MIYLLAAIAVIVPTGAPRKGANKGHAGGRGVFEAFPLQRHVGGVVALLEHAVFLLEIEDRARGDRNNEFSVQ